MWISTIWREFPWGYVNVSAMEASQGLNPAQSRLPLGTQGIEKQETVNWNIHWHDVEDREYAAGGFYRVPSLKNKTWGELSLQSVVQSVNNLAGWPEKQLHPTDMWFLLRAGIAHPCHHQSLYSPQVQRNKRDGHSHPSVHPQPTTILWPGWCWIRDETDLSDKTGGK